MPLKNTSVVPMESNAAVKTENTGRDNLTLTGHERFLDADDIIVSKTNEKGWITYANEVFLDISGYVESEVLGQPHSMIRHPHMPRAIFKLLWETIGQGNEIFAYVVNRCKNGDHYWVLAHVTPSYSPQGTLLGYHSNRRAPRREALDVIQPLYQKLLKLEQSAGNRKEGLAQSFGTMQKVLAERNITYPEFVLSL